jgi:hypothetical protein
MLKVVDKPVLVQNPGGSYDPAVRVNGLLRARGIGPVGWNNALLELLGSCNAIRVPASWRVAPQGTSLGMMWPRQVDGSNISAASRSRLLTDNGALPSASLLDHCGDLSSLFLPSRPQGRDPPVVRQVHVNLGCDEQSDNFLMSRTAAA